LAEDSPELLFRAIVYHKEHDNLKFWGLSGDLDRQYLQKHSLDTGDGGVDAQEENNARAN
jgi:hypothetical protein